MLVLSSISAALMWTICLFLYPATRPFDDVQVKTRLEMSQAANEAATAGETLRLGNGNRNVADGELSFSQKMESCCT